MWHDKCKYLMFVLEYLYNSHQATGLYIDMYIHLVHPNRLHYSYSVKSHIYQHLN